MGIRAPVTGPGELADDRAVHNGIVLAKGNFAQAVTLAKWWRFGGFLCLGTVSSPGIPACTILAIRFPTREPHVRLPITGPGQPLADLVYPRVVAQRLEDG